MIRDVKMGPDYLSVACTLNEMGWCYLEIERLGQAEGFFRRELEIREQK